MGLFGAFVVEPRGSSYLEPLGSGDPTPATSGWQTIIKNGTGPDFREFVLIYHEERLVRQCDAGDSGRSEVSIGVLRNGGQCSNEGGGRKASPFCFVWSIWYDN